MGSKDWKTKDLFNFSRRKERRKIKMPGVNPIGSAMPQVPVIPQEKREEAQVGKNPAVPEKVREAEIRPMERKEQGSRAKLMCNGSNIDVIG